jgi:RND superfamily putative drug exporter
MAGALYRLARFCVRYRFAVLAAWILLTVALVGVSHRLGDNTNDNASLPGTNSQQAADTLSKSFPDQANGTSPIVLHVSSGKLTDSKYSQAVNQAAADVAKAPDVASVVNPLTSQGASALSKDQSTGYLSVTLSVSPGSLSVNDAQTIIDAAAKPAQAAGIQVETGGQLGDKVSKPSTETSELIGILAAMVIIAVGTALTGGPPHRSQRAGLPHWAPALGTGVKPRIREGMHNAGGRQPPIRQAVHAFPVQAGALAAAL